MYPTELMQEMAKLSFDSLISGGFHLRISIRAQRWLEWIREYGVEKHMLHTSTDKQVRNVIFNLQTRY